MSTWRLTGISSNKNPSVLSDRVTLGGGTIYQDEGHRRSRYVNI